jgi:hypothetical protein
MQNDAKILRLNACIANHFTDALMPLDASRLSPNRAAAVMLNNMRAITLNPVATSSSESFLLATPPSESKKNPANALKTMVSAENCTTNAATIAMQEMIKAFRENVIATSFSSLFAE